MIRDYRGCSYKARYDCTLKLKNEKVVDFKDHERACFGRIFDSFRGVESIYQGSYIIRCHKKFDQNNYCAMNKDQIKKVLRFMREYFEIKTRLTEDNNDYIFHLNIEGKPIKHKFVLTFMRVFFEFPYNELALDVMRIREQKEINNVNYSRKSFLELYQIACCTYNGWIGGGHSLFIYPDPTLTKKDYRERLNKSFSRVQQVINGDIEIYQELKNARLPSYYQDWDENAPNRITEYAKNFEILRNYNKKHEKNIRRRARKAVQ